MEEKPISRKDTGALGERIVAAYLVRHGFSLIARNVSRKTGELDLVVRKGETLHAVEVKTLRCREFPGDTDRNPQVLYDPSNNLHARKIGKVARTMEWYAAETGWKGELQVDGALVWIRSKDGKALVRYLPQILGE